MATMVMMMLLMMAIIMTILNKVILMAKHMIARKHFNKNQRNAKECFDGYVLVND